MYSTEEIIEAITPIFKEVFEDDAIVVTPELVAADVELWDSMTNVLLIDKIEKHFSIKFNLMDIMRMQNVGDLINRIVDLAK